MCALSCIGTASGKSPGQMDPQYLIDTWDTEDGLPDNSITAVVQDQRGYLWIGTFGGLVRFDGTNFTVFDRFNTPQLPDAGIVNLHLDHSGRLWVSTVGGLVVRDGSNWFKPDGWSGDFVRTFTERANGDLLLTTFDGHLLEWHGGKLRPLELPGGAGNGYFGYADEKGQWWVVRKDFVGYWDGGKWIPIAGPDLAARCCCNAGDGAMWLLTDKSLMKWRDGHQVGMVQLSDGPQESWGMREDTKGNVWVTTEGHGLYRVSPTTGQIRRWGVDDGLAANGTRFVFQDTQQNLWIGTGGGGLQRFKRRRFSSIGSQQGLPERAVHSVWPLPAGGVLIGMYGAGPFRYRDGKIEKMPGWTGTGYVQSVLTDRAGRTWVGTYSQGIWLYNGGNWRNITFDESGGNNAVSLFEDSRGRVWIDGGGGIAVYEGGKFQLIHAHPGDPGLAFKFAEDTAGNIWAANRKGVFRIDQRRMVELTEGTAPIHNVVSIYGDRAGNLWMAADHGDLLCLRQGKFGRLNGGSGLPVGRIRALIEDEQGYLWMTSLGGIHRVRRDDAAEYALSGRGSLAVNVVTRDDGLPSVDFFNQTQPACGRGDDGRLWFATARGIASVDPTQLQLDFIPPPLEVQALIYQGPQGRSDRAYPTRVANEVRIEAPFSRAPNLPAGTRSLEIQFAAITMTSPTQIRYQVKLEPLDTDWQDVGNQRTVNYRDPEPGNYVFRVRAADEDGVWSKDGEKLAFTIKPFFWQTLWFRGGSGLLLIGVGALSAWWFSRWRHRSELEVRRQRDELAHLSRVAMLGELSGSLAHELNQPLAAILSNAQAARRFMAQEPMDVNELEEILDDIIDSDKRAGEIIQRLRLMLKKGEVNRQPLDVNEQVLDVLRLVRTDLANHDVEVETDLAQGLPSVLGDRVQLQQVMLNLIMNASDAVIANGNRDRRIVIRTRRLDDGSVRTSVVDQGPGIPPDQLNKVFEPFFTTKSHGMGLGLAVCRGIVSAHQGVLSVSNNSDRGATFDMTLHAVEGAV